MFSSKFALVTPSYHVDYEACKLLVESVERHVPREFHHYLIIPKSDYALFQSLESDRVILKSQEDFLPWWIIPSGISKKWYLSLKSLPVRGWIRQQIVKLATGEFLPEENFLIIDSDTFFVRDFDLSKFERDGKTSFYCEQLQTSLALHDEWQVNSAAMFKEKLDKPLPEIYVGPFIFWRKEVLQSMFRHLAEVNGCSWQLTLCRQLSISEYTIYGTYLRKILGVENSGHFLDQGKYTHDYYDEVPLNQKELEEFSKGLKPEHIGVSISSKSFTPIALIREVFGY